MSGSVSGSEYESDSELVSNSGSGSRFIMDLWSVSGLVLKSLFFILFEARARSSNATTVSVSCSQVVLLRMALATGARRRLVVE